MSAIESFLRNGQAAEAAVDDLLRKSRLPNALKATSKSHVRRIALNYATGARAHKFERVSDEFLASVESNAINFIKDRVNRHPSKGVTLR